MDLLIEKVKNDTKPSYRARLNDNGSLYNNLANIGCDKGMIVYVKRKGDYKGFSIKMLEKVKPLITDIKIVNALIKLKEENIQGAISVLNIKDKVRSHGIIYLYKFINYWLNKNNIIPTKEIIMEINKDKNSLDEDSKKFIDKKRLRIQILNFLY